MSIKAKILGSLIILAFISALGAGWSFQSAQSNQNVLNDVNERFENAVTKSAELAVLIKDIQINVIQVQQFLTDLSVTRGLDGLDDGGTEAATHAADFSKNIKAAEKLASALNLDDVLIALNDADRSFPAFYDNGKRMADAYVKNGTSAGNKLMGELDASSQKLGDAMDQLSLLSQDLMSTSIKKIQEDLVAINQEAKFLTILTIVLGGISITACFIIGWSVKTSVLTPLLSITDAMGRLAAGQLQITIDGQNRGDEVGDIARALATFKDGLLETDTLRAEQTKQKERAEQEQRAAMTKMADNFESAVGSIIQGVADAALQLQTSAKAMSSYAQTSTSQSKAAVDVSARMRQDVDGVSTATSQLSEAVNEISRQITTAATMTRAALEAATTTSAQVDQLSAAAKAISAVTQTISEIASQTNLLALNATIEAARAGEAGKGFAVVAGEVKALSNQTAAATDRIGTEIANVQNVTEQCVLAIKGIADKISEINQVSSTIAAAVEEQTASTSEISRSVEAAAAGTQGVSKNIEEVSKASDMTGTAAHDVLNAAEGLLKQSTQLRNQMTAFLSSIRKP